MRKTLPEGIYRRGDSPFLWVSYRDASRKVHQESSGTTKVSEAVAFRNQRIGEIVGGTFIGRKAEHLTFEDLKEIYRDHYELRGLRRDTARYRAKRLEGYFGPDRAIDITTDRLTDYQKWRRKAGAAAGTINRELAALHRMFVLACKAGRYARARIPEFPDALKENPPRQGFFEFDVADLVAQHLPEDERDAFEYALHSGWRKDEILTLPWSMVDLDANELRLSPEFSKTGEGRVIPLTKPLRVVLERRWAKRRLDCPLVFHRDGKRIHNWRRTWVRACKVAGLTKQVQGRSGRLIDRPLVTLHDCRRTAVRNLDRAGVQRGVAMKLVGHKTESMYRRYNIVSRRDLDAAAVAYEQYMESLRASSQRKVIRLR